jgi:hypothetical protein
LGVEVWMNRKYSEGRRKFSQEAHECPSPASVECLPLQNPFLAAFLDHSYVGDTMSTLVTTVSTTKSLSIPKWSLRGSRNRFSRAMSFGSRNSDDDSALDADSVASVIDVPPNVDIVGRSSDQCVVEDMPRSSGHSRAARPIERKNSFGVSSLHSGSRHSSHHSSYDSFSSLDSEARHKSGGTVPPLRRVPSKVSSLNPNPMKRLPAPDSDSV